MIGVNEKGTSDIICWRKIRNEVDEITINGSFRHTFESSEKKKTKRRTKALNRELKKFASLKSYNEYVNIKTKVLRNFTDNEDTDQETDILHENRIKVESPLPVLKNSTTSRKKKKHIVEKALPTKRVRKNLTSLLEELPSADSKRRKSTRIGKQLDSKVPNENNCPIESRSAQVKITSTEIVTQKYTIVKRGKGEKSDELLSDAASQRDARANDSVAKSSDDDRNDDTENESQEKSQVFDSSQSFDADDEDLRKNESEEKRLQSEASESSDDDKENENKEKRIASEIPKNSDNDSEDHVENENKEKRIAAESPQNSDNDSEDDVENENKEKRIAAELPKNSDNDSEDEEDKENKEKRIPSDLPKSSDDDNENDNNEDDIRNESKEKRLQPELSQISDDDSEDDEENQSQAKRLPSKLSKSSDDDSKDDDKENENKEKLLSSELPKSSDDDSEDGKENEKKKKLLSSELPKSSDTDGEDDKENQSQAKRLPPKLSKSSDDDSKDDDKANENKEKLLSSELPKSSDDDSEDGKENEKKKKLLSSELPKSSDTDSEDDEENQSQEKRSPSKLSKSADDDDKENENKENLLSSELSKSSDDDDGDGNENESKKKRRPPESSKSVDDENEGTENENKIGKLGPFGRSSSSQEIDACSPEELLSYSKVLLNPGSSLSQTISDPSDSDESIIDRQTTLRNYNDDEKKTCEPLDTDKSIIDPSLSNNAAADVDDDDDGEEKDNTSDINKNTQVKMYTIDKSIVRQIRDQENIKRKVVVEKVNVSHESPQREQLAGDSDTDTQTVTKPREKSIKQQIRDQENIARKGVAGKNIASSNDIEQTGMDEENSTQVVDKSNEPIVLSRPLELNEYIDREGLVINQDLPTLTPKNIKNLLANDDEEMWLLEIPRTVITDVDKPLCGRKIALDGGKLKIDDTIYESNFKIDKSLTCILRKKKKPSYKIVNVEVVGYAIVGRKSSSHVITSSSRVPDDKNVDAPPPLFPKNLKSRDPLDGLLENKPTSNSSLREDSSSSLSPSLKKKRKKEQSKFWNIDNFVSRKKAHLSVQEEIHE